MIGHVARVDCLLRSLVEQVEADEILLLYKLRINDDIIRNIYRHISRKLRIGIEQCVRAVIYVRVRERHCIGIGIAYLYRCSGNFLFLVLEDFSGGNITELARSVVTPSPYIAVVSYNNSVVCAHIRLNNVL